MKRTFIFKDNKSAKFWEIEISGSSFTTYYGRIGSSPRMDKKSFSSNEIAQKEYNKIVQEKLKKGYTEQFDSKTSQKKLKEPDKIESKSKLSNLKVPAKFKKYSEQIQKTIKPKIDIQLKGKPTHPWSSKVGGNPYLPLDTKYPVNSKGRFLFFLAQINFGEVPSLEGFPQKGIVQFYIDDNDLHGLDLNSFFESSYKILYFPNIIEDKSKLIKDFSFLPEFEYVVLDSDFEKGMKFKTNLEPLPPNDYRFEIILDNLAEDEELTDEYYEFANSSGHKIGGYPTFAQSDPRESIESKKGDEYELLFQLDTDEGIMWGDSGVGNFFITQKALKKLDFSKVLYNWDCC